MTQEPSMMDSAVKQLLNIERGVAGRSRWDQDERMDSKLSLLCIGLSVSISIYIFSSTHSVVGVGGDVTSSD